MADAPQPHRRWFRLTPNRLLLGLLAVEGFLLLCERFHWFAFNEKKGWTVLFAIAALGVALLLLTLWLIVSLLLRRRFQFGLRSLLVFVVVCAVVCSWFAVEMEKANRQREAVEAIEKLGGSARYDWQREAVVMTIADGRVTYDCPVGEFDNRMEGAEPPAPIWLRKLLGDDFFGKVTKVSLLNTQVTDAGLEHLKGLTQLKDLCLDATQVTDAGLKSLKGLNQLQVLDLGSTQVTDAGLRRLKGLAQLRRLDLNSTQVTGAGLECLKGLTRLTHLCLAATQVTDDGMEHLRGLTQLQKLSLSETKVGDAGLGHLKVLTQLKELCLFGTKVTNTGLEHLKGLGKLQTLVLNYTQVTDVGLECLKGLTQLRWLFLTGTKVTPRGFDKLHSALPDCQITG